MIDDLHKCRTCKGTGKRWYKSVFEDYKYTFYCQIDCYWCDGTGYVDWMDNIYKNPKKKYIVTYGDER